MDLSEIPHDQWDYAVRQLVQLNSVEEEGPNNSNFGDGLLEAEHLNNSNFGDELLEEEGLNNSIFGDELLEVGPLQSLPPLQTDGFYMDVANESIMPLTLEYCPELSDNAGQEFGIPGIPSTCGLDITSLGIPPREESFGDNILSTTTSNPDDGTLGVSQFGDSPPTVSLDPYPESLNEWLMYFTHAGVGVSFGIPEPEECGQNDMSLWASPSHECSSDLHLALMNGYYAGEVEPELSCTKEEESVQWSRKNKRKHQAGSGKKRDYVQRRRKRACEAEEETEMVQRRGKRSSRSENGEQHEVVRMTRKRASQFVTGEGSESQRSVRVRRAPRRYIDEWCKPKEKGKRKARTAASKGFGSDASSSFPDSSTTGNQVHGADASELTSFMSIVTFGSNPQLAGIQESIVPWWGPHNLLSNPGY